MQLHPKRAEWTQSLNQKQRLPTTPAPVRRKCAAQEPANRVKSAPTPYPPPAFVDNKPLTQLPTRNKGLTGGNPATLHQKWCKFVYTQVLWLPGKLKFTSSPNHPCYTLETVPSTPHPGPPRP